MLGKFTRKRNSIKFKKEKIMTKYTTIDKNNKDNNNEEIEIENFNLQFKIVDSFK